MSLDPIPHVVEETGAASSAPEGSIPIALFGAGADPAQIEQVVEASLAEDGPVKDALNATIVEVGGASFAANGVIAHAARVADIKRSKGGRIGTSGKGVVAFRIDHGMDRFLAIHWPLMRARSISCGFGVVTDAVGKPAHFYEPTVSTWADARAMHFEGAEIWSHSATHRDPAPIGTDGGFTLEQEIAGSRATLEANNLWPMGWQMPGISGCQTPGYSDRLDSLEKLGTTEAGQRLMGAYGLIENYRQGEQRIMPTDGCYLLSHVTIDSMSLAGAKAYVDRAVNDRVGIEFMFHPTVLGTAGNMSIADFTALLDYVVTKRDADAVEVLTPSGLAFADPSSTYRLDWIKDGGFEGLTKVGAKIGPWTCSTDAGIALHTDGGHTGTNYVRFSGTNNLLAQEYIYVAQGGFKNAAMEVECWVRNPTPSVAQARINVYISSPGGYPTLGSKRDVFIPLTANQPWTKYRVPFCVPREAEAISVRVGRLSTTPVYPGDVDFDDIKVRPI